MSSSWALVEAGCSNQRQVAQGQVLVGVCALCVCVCACVRMCVHVPVWVGGWVGVVWCIIIMWP